MYVEHAAGRALCVPQGRCDSDDQIKAPFFVDLRLRLPTSQGAKLDYDTGFEVVPLQQKVPNWDLCGIWSQFGPLVAFEEVQRWLYKKKTVKTTWILQKATVTGSN